MLAHENIASGVLDDGRQRKESNRPSTPFELNQINYLEHIWYFPSFLSRRIHRPNDEVVRLNGMKPVRDYRTPKDLGIRIKGNDVCRVIRQMKGEWVEIGRDYELPVDPNVLIWSPPGIPGSILAVALRIYELDHPESDLRLQLLSKRVPFATRVKVRYARTTRPPASVR